MILLDTNVISELMRDQCNPQVLDWSDRQRWDDLGVSMICARRFGDIDGAARGRGKTFPQIDCPIAVTWTTL